MMEPRSLLLLLLAGLAVLTDARCEPYCEEQCTELNGDVGAECGGCGESYACRPGATGFISQQEGLGGELPKSPPISSAETEQTDKLQQIDGGGINQAGVCDDETEQSFTNAFATLANLTEELFWETLARVPPECDGAEDLSALHRQGYVVVRGLVPADSLWTRDQLPVMGENSEGPARFSSPSYSRSELEASRPQLLRALEGALSEWYDTGLLPPSQSTGKMKVGGYMFIHTDPNAPREYCMEPCLGRKGRSAIWDLGSGIWDLGSWSGIWDLELEI